MPAERPTILATSGGLTPGRRVRWDFAPLTDFAIELADVDGRAPRICLLATAMGDSPAIVSAFYDAALQQRLAPSHVALLPMPNVDDLRGHLLGQDVIWVFGGSVAGLLALWRLHGLDTILREAWHAGVVLTGVSAGSICWHVGGTTDSFGPTLVPVTNGLAFLPYSNSPHHDVEEQRRPLIHRLIAEGALPDGYATENGTGLVFFGTDLREAFTEVEGKVAYSLRREGNTTREEPLPTRVL